MKILVINLERCPDRRTSIEESLKRTGLDYEFFSAVDGRRGEHQSLSLYDEDICLRSFGAPLTPGEVGCFASHYLIWKRCVEACEPITVLEDDVLLTPRFPKVHHLAAERISAHRLIRLAATFDRPYRVLEDIDGTHALVRYLRGPAGAQCYSLSPEGAAALLAGACRWVEPIDVYMDRFWHHGVEVKALLPFEVRSVDEGTLPSSIGQRASRRSGVAKLRREASRMRDLVARYAYNLTRH